MNVTKIDIEAIIAEQMIQISKGTIELRDDRIKEKWTTEIKSFFILKYPVTQDLYLAVTNQNPSTFQGDRLPVEDYIGEFETIILNFKSMCILLE